MGSGSSSNVKPFDPQKKPVARSGAGSNTKVESLSAPATVTDSGIYVSSRLPTECATKTIEVPERPSNSMKHPGNSRVEGQTFVKDALLTNLEDVSSIKSKLAVMEKERDELKTQNELLEQQIGELESHNLDLAERVQVLDEQLETECRTALINTQTPCVNTIKAKDQCIAKLEKQTATIQDEISKLKARYKKKIRQMNAQLSEAKHESSLTMFETKAELQRLKVENVNLLRKAKAISIREEGDYPNTPAVTSISMSDRTGLILELSSQVSAQEKQIMELEVTIQDRDKMINELVQNEKPQAGSSRGKRGARGNGDTLFEAGSWKKNVEQENWSLDEVDAHTALIFATDQDDELGLPSTCNSGHSPELSELKALAGDMKQAQRKKSKKKNLLRERVKASPPAETTGLDSRESSGTSRDSGVASGDSDVHVYKTRSQRISKNTQRKKSGFDLLNTEEEDDGLELQSFSGTPFPPQAPCTESPDSLASQWLDDDHDNCAASEAERRSNISVSSIRRVSAPKMKKKHALSDHDLLVDSLVNDLDQPLRQSAVPESRGINTREGMHAFSLGFPVTGH